jgi:hypothetical protein
MFQFSVIFERIGKQTRFRILNAICKKLAATLSCPDLEMAAPDYFERLGHDNHRRLCRVHGWEAQEFCAARRVTDDFIEYCAS